ncbi:hypothetical protein BKA62DRAFT_51370 [Auriculariales sp. MPI-PUGE-AT-0066]|nr:hypothetical protein BKA62DRAFT_51370 [Auriculariales sp. MPI-PUGE-AT-0066]
MERLPIEIVTYILETAAYMLRATDRGAVVNLALTSSFSYSTVAPILYERVVIADVNYAAFSVLLANGPLAAKVLQYTRFICVPPNREEVLFSAAHLFPNVSAVYGSQSVWEDIVAAQAQSSVAIVNDLRAWYIGFKARACQPNLSIVTRLHTFFPCSSKDRRGLPRDIAEQIQHILEVLPSLTHLGFSHVNPESPIENAESKDLEIYDTVMRTVVASKESRLQVVALRITGWAATCLEAFVRIARDIDEAGSMLEVRIWVDSREITTWQTEVDAMVEDSRKERSIWTEAQALSYYVPDVTT